VVWSILDVMKFKYVVRILLIWAVLYLSVIYLDAITLLPTEYGIVPSFLLLFIIFAAVEMLLYPVMHMLILPLRILTFGFASAILSVNLVYGIAFVFPLFVVSSFWQAVVLGTGMGIVRMLTK